jgi:hypothetical protein
VNCHCFPGIFRFTGAAKWQIEFSRHFGPELPQNIETHILHDGESHSRCDRRGSTLVAGMVSVAQDDGACSAKPFRRVEHARAIDAVGDERMSHGMEQPFPKGTVCHAVVARVFGKDHWKREILKKLGGSLVGRSGGESLGIPLHALAKSTIAIRCLVESGVEAGIEERDPIERILDEENKFISRTERAKIHTGQVVRRMNGFSFERARE